MKTALTSLAAASLLLGTSAAADIVVIDGMSLADAVDQAVDGETIFIQSEGVFEETITVVNKSITIRQGFGFDRPTIRGTNGQPAIVHNGGLNSELHLIGLEFEPATDASIFIDALSSFDSTSVAQPSKLVLQDCLVAGRCTVFAEGNYKQVTELIDTEVEGRLRVDGDDTARHELLFDGLTVQNRFELDHEGTGGSTLTAVDSLFWREVEIGAFFAWSSNFEFRRCRFEDSVEVEDDATPASTGLLESCLLVGDGNFVGATQVGLNVASDFNLRGVNLTITGFDIGLFGGIQSSYTNLALFNNEVDLSPIVLPFQIESSLISDGTYDGLNGNFTGIPVVGADFGLASFSIGTDAGNTLVPELGTFDLLGAPRVQDANGDGNSQVSVGAIESPSLPPQASAEPINFGTNEKWLEPGGTPILGETFTVKVVDSAQTQASFVGLGNFVPAPPIPGFNGQLLLNLDPALPISVAPVAHDFPIPNSLALIGFEIDMQGLRLDQSGGELQFTFTNALSLKLGY
ncbi:MAG: hypothetical protein AAFZ65_12155 [Planctomycetota bacterium]